MRYAVPGCGDLGRSEEKPRPGGAGCTRAMMAAGRRDGEGCGVFDGRFAVAASAKVAVRGNSD